MSIVPRHAGTLALKDLYCPHCGSLNAEDEQRCRKCGRRFVPSLPEQDGPSDTAAHPEERRTPRQAALFDDRPKIIPFESLTRKGRSVSRPAPPPAPRSERPMQDPRPPARQTGQQRLDLRAPAQRPRKTINNDATVAPLKLRLKAAALDALFIAIGLGLAVASFLYAGGQFQFTSRTTPLYAATLVLMVGFYELFWCLLARESPGMQCVGLRVLTFDGDRPTRGQFIGRFFVSLVSAAVVIGLLWTFIDGESLTWHDHISKTFPTSWNRNAGTFHRQ